MNQKGEVYRPRLIPLICFLPPITLHIFTTPDMPTQSEANSQ